MMLKIWPVDCMLKYLAMVVQGSEKNVSVQIVIMSAASTRHLRETGALRRGVMDAAKGVPKCMLITFTP